MGEEEEMVEVVEKMDGEMVEEEEGELVIDWEDVNNGTEERKGSADGLWEEFKDGTVEEVKEDGIGESEECWMEGK